MFQECPLALEAAEGLLKLGVKGIEVNSLMLEGNPNFNVDWYDNLDYLKCFEFSAMQICS